MPDDKTTDDDFLDTPVADDDVASLNDIETFEEPDAEDFEDDEVIEDDPVTGYFDDSPVIPA